MSFTTTRCLLVAIAIAISSFPFTSGCSCGGDFEHLQEKFCKAKYAFEFVVTEKTTVDSPDPWLYPYGEHRYDINVTRMYKSSPEYEALTSKNHVFSPIMCGLWLQKGVKYVIMGTPINGRIDQTGCDQGFREADEITAELQAYLEGGFSQNCDKCTIQYCFIPWLCNATAGDLPTCGVELEHFENSCLWDFAHCKRVDDGCAWSDGGSGELNTCLYGQP